MPCVACAQPFEARTAFAKRGQPREAKHQVYELQCGHKVCKTHVGLLHLCPICKRDARNFMRWKACPDLALAPATLDQSDDDSADQWTEISSVHSDAKSDSSWAYISDDEDRAEALNEGTTKTEGIRAAEVLSADEQAVPSNENEEVATADEADAIEVSDPGPTSKDGQQVAAEELKSAPSRESAAASRVKYLNINNALAAMGFDRNLVCLALDECDGHPERAVEWLLQLECVSPTQAGKAAIDDDWEQEDGDEDDHELDAPEPLTLGSFVGNHTATKASRRRSRARAAKTGRSGDPSAFEESASAAEGTTQTPGTVHSAYCALFHMCRNPGDSRLCCECSDLRPLSERSCIDLGCLGLIPARAHFSGYCAECKERCIGVARHKEKQAEAVDRTIEANPKLAQQVIKASPKPVKPVANFRAKPVAKAKVKPVANPKLATKSNHTTHGAHCCAKRHLCQLSPKLSCCRCSDGRPRDSVCQYYKDGVGMVATSRREYYCPGCKAAALDS